MDLLKAYNDDDSNSSSGESQEEPTTKKLKRLPLPDKVKQMFAKEKSIEDNPTNHQGRIRSFAGEPGNWTSFIYIPVQLKPKRLEKLKRYLPNLGTMTLEENMHMSICSTFILKYQLIDPFVLSLKEAFKDINGFSTILSGLKIFVNEEKTRTFLSIVSNQVNELLNLNRIAKSVLKEYNLKPLQEYTKYSFHVSIAWCLDDQKENLKRIKTKIETDLIQEILPLPWQIQVNELYCNIGNKTYKIPLK